jgi:multicomponent Na+:H+ antiporter subunit E
VTLAALPACLALAVVWFALVGRIDGLTAALGVPVVGSAWLLFARLMGPLPAVSPGRLGRMGFGIARYLFGHVLPDIVRSTARVVQEVLRPHLAIRPAIVAVPLPEATPLGLIVLAYGISLTPGQQIVALDEAAGVLYVHGIDVPDPAAMRTEIQGLFQRYLAEATRW